jgi:hypothetical protein
MKLLLSLQLRLSLRCGVVVARERLTQALELASLHIADTASMDLEST